MNTQIEYLQELREDLLSAAWREADRAPARRSFRASGRLSRGKLVAAVAAVSLILAGAIGWFALPGDQPNRILGFGDTPTNGSAAEKPFGDQPAIAQSGSSSSAHRRFSTSSGDLAAVAPAAAPSPVKAAGSTGYAPSDKSVAGSGGASSTTGSATSGPAGDFTRIVKTAEVGLVVPTGGSLGDRFDSARGVAHQNGGFVTNSSIQPGKIGEMEIRVPARNFDATITALEKLGTLEHESIKGQDVTAQFVDLQARLSIAQTHRDVLQKLLAKAHTPAEIVRMQNLVDDAQRQVEELQGEIRLIKNQTSKATIDLSLRMAGVAVPTQGAVKHPGLGSAWAHAIAGFFGVVFAVVVGLGYLVPIAVLLLIAWLVYRRVRRRSPAFIDD
jgi:hypothetical protein